MRNSPHVRTATERSEINGSIVPRKRKHHGVLFYVTECIYRYTEDGEISRIEKKGKYATLRVIDKARQEICVHAAYGEAGDVLGRGQDFRVLHL